MKYVLKNVMKAGILLALVLLGTACTQNDEPLQQPQGGRTYVVAMEQPTTSRATLTVNGSKATFQFEAGDKIWITVKKTADNAYEAVEVTLTETEGALGFTLPEGYDTPVQAVFGATTKTVDDNGAINQVTLSSYNYTTEYPSDAHAVLYAEFPTDNSNTLEFQYLTGILSVTLDYVPASANQFVFSCPATDTPQLSGSFALVEADGGKKQISSTTGGTGTIVFNFPAGTLRPGMTFYVPLPVGTYEGFGVDLYDTTISTTNPLFTKVTNTSKSYTIDRATLNTLPAVEVLQPLNVAGAGSLNAADLSNYISANGTLAITGSINDTDLETIKTWLQGSTVPATLKSLDLSGTTGLTEIPAEFFGYLEGNDTYKGLPATLTEIYLPIGVTEIGYNAFFGCTSLNTISMPAVTTIGDGAFGSCTNLNTVLMPAVTTIGNYVFKNCTSLNIDSMPAAETIGTGAFIGCTNLNTVSMPVAKTIGKNAFENCPNLNAVSMPAATMIGESAFENCPNLNTVLMPVAETIDTGAFRDCTNLSAVSIPAAETIGSYAFQNCTSLETVSMPAAETISGYVFSKCTALERIDLPAVTELEWNIFSSCNALKEITLGSGGESYTFTSVVSNVFYGYTPPTDAVLKLYGAGNTVAAENDTRTWKPVDTNIDISGFSEVWLNDKQVYPAP